MRHAWTFYNYQFLKASCLMPCCCHAVSRSLPPWVRHVHYDERKKCTKRFRDFSICEMPSKLYNLEDDREDHHIWQVTKDDTKFSIEETLRKILYTFFWWFSMRNIIYEKNTSRKRYRDVSLSQYSLWTALTATFNSHAPSYLLSFSRYRRVREIHIARARSTSRLWIIYRKIRIFSPRCCYCSSPTMLEYICRRARRNGPREVAKRCLIRTIILWLQVGFSRRLVLYECRSSAPRDDDTIRLPIWSIITQLGRTYIIYHTSADYYAPLYFMGWHAMLTFWKPLCSLMHRDRQVFRGMSISCRRPVTRQPGKSEHCATKAASKHASSPFYCLPLPQTATAFYFR